MKIAFCLLGVICLLAPSSALEASVLGGGSHGSHMDKFIEKCETTFREAVQWETEVLEHGPPKGDFVLAIAKLNELMNTIQDLLLEIRTNGYTGHAFELERKMGGIIYYLHFAHDIDFSPWHWW